MALDSTGILLSAARYIAGSRSEISDKVESATANLIVAIREAERLNGEYAKIRRSEDDRIGMEIGELPEISADMFWNKHEDYLRHTSSNRRL